MAAPPSQESIRSMKAGRELDIAVAELVIGCREKRKWKPNIGEWLYDLVIPGGVNRIDFVEPGACWSACPAYSTDPAASAELRRHLTRHLEADCRWRHGHPATVTVSLPHRGATIDVTEPVTGDVVAAECAAWARVALLAAVGG